MAPTIKAVCDEAARVAFGSPLVQNNLRALVAEVIVDFALKSTWTRCAGDWNGWDFQHSLDKTRLELKQSAHLQTWASPSHAQSARFDIAKRAGYYEGADWKEHPGRHAAIYVFAYHPIDDKSADHRDPSQWQFYVVSTAKLPLTGKTIGLPALKKLSDTYRWDQLFDEVERERLALRG